MDCLEPPDGFEEDPSGRRNIKSMLSSDRVLSHLVRCQPPLLGIRGGRRKVVEEVEDEKGRIALLLNAGAPF